MLQVQDVLGLGSQARMNMPGVAGGQWRWRLRDGQLTAAHWRGGCGGLTRGGGTVALVGVRRCAALTASPRERGPPRRPAGPLQR